MKLYYAQGACSLAPHLILEELGLPYEGQLLSFDNGDNEKPEYKKLNPTGAVPTLVLDNGQVLTENVAILSYLADLKPQSNLIPAAGSFERIRAIEWLAYCTTSVHKAFGNIFAASFMVKNAEGAKELGATGRHQASEAFDLIEQKLKQIKTPFVMGSNYSVCDAYLFVFFSWAKELKFDVSHWPLYGALASRVAERPASQRVLKAEDLLD